MLQKNAADNSGAALHDFVARELLPQLPGWSALQVFDHHEIDVDGPQGWEFGDWDTPACLLLRHTEICSHVIELHLGDASAVTLTSGIFIPRANFFATAHDEIRSYSCFARNLAVAKARYALDQRLVSDLLRDVVPWFDGLDELAAVLRVFDACDGEFEQMAAAMLRTQANEPGGRAALLRQYGQSRATAWKAEYRAYCATFGVELPAPEPTAAVAPVALWRTAPPAVERMLHPTFGAGTVLQTRDSGAGRVLTIQFDTGATKDILARYVEPLDEPAF